MNVISVIIGILMIGVIVFVHEFGHYIIARKNDVHVPEFWIGFGPKLISFTRNGTEFSIRPILFGGACVFDDLEAEALELEDEDEDDPDDEDHDSELEFVSAANDDKPELEDVDFSHYYDDLSDEFSDDAASSADPAQAVPEKNVLKDQSPWVRLWVLFAGPFFNLILGFVCSVIIICCVGIDLPVVGDVTEGLPAQAAGIEAYDRITQINDTRIFTFRDLRLFLDTYDGDEVLHVTYERDGQEIETDIVPVQQDGAYYMGVHMNLERTRTHNAGTIIRYGVHEVGFWVKYTVQSLKDLVTGHIPLSSLSGPVAVVSTVSEVVEESSNDGMYYVFLNIMNLIALLSINIGVMNLLPIPGLDGGKMLLVLAELVRGKRLPAKAETAVTFVGVIFLVILMIFVFFKDIFMVLG